MHKSVQLLIVTFVMHNLKTLSTVGSNRVIFWNVILESSENNHSLLWSTEYGRVSTVLHVEKQLTPTNHLYRSICWFLLLFDGILVCTIFSPNFGVTSQSWSFWIEELNYWCYLWQSYQILTHHRMVAAEGKGPAVNTQTVRVVAETVGSEWRQKAQDRTGYRCLATSQQWPARLCSQWKLERCWWS